MEHRHRAGRLPLGEARGVLERVDRRRDKRRVPRTERLPFVPGRRWCAGASAIGTVGGGVPGLVTLKSCIGATRVLDVLSGEQLPRIC